MTLQTTLLAALTLLSLQVPSAVQSADQTLEPSAVIERLKKPAPATIDFREVRFSALLDAPLAVRGTLRYLAPDHLERLVREPYLERTTIRGESVRVERDGEKLTTFALKRAPELKGLLSAFGALLTGDSTAVAKNFEIEATGDAKQWELRLVPRDARTRERVKDIVVIGRDDAPSCLLMSGAGEARTVSLFAELSKAAPQKNVTVNELTTLCRGGNSAR